MAISTLAAVALGAGALGSAGLSMAASNKAANAARDAANSSAAVQREQLSAAQNALNPFVQAGVPASGQINALLGLGGNQPNWGDYLTANPDVMQGYYQTADTGQFATPEAYAQWHYKNYGQNEGRALPASDATASAQNAFDIFKNSIGYQNTLNSAMDAVNSGYAGAGVIKSGAAIKGAQDRAGRIAQDTMGQYLTALGNQQGVGMSAGSALAGVGQNYANSMSFINSNRADAIGNSALLNAQNTNNMLGGLTAGIFKYGVKG